MRQTLVILCAAHKVFSYTLIHAMPHMLDDMPWIVVESSGGADVRRETARRNPGYVQLMEKVSASTGPAAIYLPLKGVSAIDAQGQAFDDPAAGYALFDAIRQARVDVELVELEHHINDAEFAEAAAGRLLDIIRRSSPHRASPMRT